MNAFPRIRAHSARGGPIALMFAFPWKQGQGATDGGPTATNNPGLEAGGTAEGNDRESPPEEPLEYTDASGRLKFNKRSVGLSAGAGRADSARDKKKTKRTKLAKLSNKKLLSFGEDEDG